MAVTSGTFAKQFNDRRIEERLIDWAAQSDRKPLLLRGVRQAGKTFAVRRFAQRFDCFIELNLPYCLAPTLADYLAWLRS